MSRSRKTSQKYSNAAMISYQRKQVYHGQKRAGMMKPAETFQQGGTQFNADSWLFWLFFLGILQSGFALPSRQKVNSRVNMASTLTAEQMRNGECNKLVDAIMETAAANDAFAERLDATLKQQDFRIICGNQKSFDENNASTRLATFLSWKNMLMIKIGNIDSNILIHEGIHAYFHSLHAQDTPCDLASDKTKTQSAVPFFPITKENMDEFNRWMNRGDKRVKHLYQLHLKDKAGKTKLSNDEKYQLLRAREKLAKTTIFTEKTTYPNTEHYLSTLRASGWPNKEKIEIMINEHVVQVSKVEVFKDRIEITNRISDPIEAIHFGLKFFETECQRNAYEDDVVKAAERVAYAMQHLDKAGMQFLYPEATEFMERQAKKCRPAENTSFRAEL